MTERSVPRPSRAAEAGSIVTGQSLVTALGGMLWREAPRCWCDGVNERQCVLSKLGLKSCIVCQAVLLQGLSSVKCST